MEALVKIEKGIKNLEEKFAAVGVPAEIFKKEASFALQALSNNKDLFNCPRMSILSAVYNIALTGLTLNPAFSYAYLVPRKRHGKSICVLDISYRGLIKIATDGNVVKSVTANCIFENDRFSAVEGTNTFLEHEPSYFDDRGKFVGAYVVVTLNNGTKKHHIMSKADIDKRKSLSMYQGKGSIWDLWYNEMAIKTVIKSAWKLWPTSCEKLANAVEILNENEGFEPLRSRNLKPIVEMPKEIKEIVEENEKL